MVPWPEQVTVLYWHAGPPNPLWHTHVAAQHSTETTQLTSAQRQSISVIRGRLTRRVARVDERARALATTEIAVDRRARCGSKHRMAVRLQHNLVALG